jgi:hypothetical protein
VEWAGSVPPRAGRAPARWRTRGGPCRTRGFVSGPRRSRHSFLTTGVGRPAARRARNLVPGVSGVRAGRAAGIALAPSLLQPRMAGKRHQLFLQAPRPMSFEPAQSVTELLRAPQAGNAQAADGLLADRNSDGSLTRTARAASGGLMVEPGALATGGSVPASAADSRATSSPVRTGPRRGGPPRSWRRRRAPPAAGPLPGRSARRPERSGHTGGACPRRDAGRRRGPAPGPARRDGSVRR